jgi:septal ring factor EnvC (AmiA/AmiB activator)
MKFKILLGIAVGLFVLTSVFSYIKYKQAEDRGAQLAKIEAEYNQAQREIDKLKSALISKDDTITVLNVQKEKAVKELAKYKADVKKQIADFEITIAAFSKIPTDTLYKSLFDRWPTFDIVNDNFVEFPVIYKFAKTHVNGMYLGLLERDNFELLYAKTDKALSSCEFINSKNNSIIFQLEDKTANLENQLIYTNVQVNLLKDNLNLSDKTLKKQKRKTFFYQGTTTVAVAGIVWSLLK